MRVNEPQSLPPQSSSSLQRESKYDIRQAEVEENGPGEFMGGRQVFLAESLRELSAWTVFEPHLEEQRLGQTEGRARQREHRGPRNWL